MEACIPEGAALHDEYLACISNVDFPGIFEKAHNAAKKITYYFGILQVR